VGVEVSLDHVRVFCLHNCICISWHVQNNDKYICI